VHDDLRQTSRRTWLRSTCLHCVALGGVFSGLNAQAQTVVPPEADLNKRFERPPIDTDEGGMWAMMDREETRLRRSPLVIRDAELNKYLQDMVCQLTQTHCPDIRIHVVRTPWFNASMAPNGMMQVWSGLLLRVENEAQLAAVLGHELAHYLERHSIERLRDFKNKAAVAQFIGMFGLVGAIGQLGVLASAFAFSREHETRADRLGMKLLQQGGWSGEEAPKVWGNLLEEVKVLGGEDAGKRSPMFATHPAIEDRRTELIKLIAPGGQSKPLALAKILEKHRMSWVQDEVRRGQFEESMVLFGRMIKTNPQDEMALYGRGESFRLRAGQNDMDKALADFQAITTRDAPERKDIPEAWRSLGLVHQQRKDAVSAAQAFEKYLSLAPDAADANLIKHYLTELKP
jgi:beta-barrel assembly-enhancing protease